MAVTLVVVDEAPLVVAGLDAVLDPFRHRVRFAGTVASGADDVDLLLHDALASAPPASAAAHAQALHARRVVFSWSDDPAMIRRALQDGASGYLSKTLEAEVLVDALERIHRGEQVVRGADGDLDVEPESVRGRWPGEECGLSARESEVLGLVCQGLSNAEIGATVFVSINTVKTYIRSTYRKIGVLTRSQAVIWGMQHGFAQQDRATSAHL